MAQSNFIDYVKIYCRSGKGGPGSAHFRREAMEAMGGPDGGDGGRGGHIILKANPQLWTLLHLKYQKHHRAEDGESGGQSRSTGKEGKDIIVEVPIGTIVRSENTGEIIAEITEVGQETHLVKGGRGGLGNDHFKSPTNQAPRYAQPGEMGQEGWFVLELKVLADVGLVGFPNAGKSTLLSVVSAARPEIANYAFTTLVPNLGVVEYRDHRSFVMADIPGIIEGAAEGKGLGTRFLRHIERNAILLFMIPCDSDNIMKEYTILLNELQKHNPDLIQKERILAITKSDMLDDELMEEMKAELPTDLETIFISSATEKNIMPLKDLIWKKITQIR